MAARLSNALYGAALARALQSEVAANGQQGSGNYRRDAWAAAGADNEGVLILLHYTALRLAFDLGGMHVRDGLAGPVALGQSPGGGTRLFRPLTLRRDPDAIAVGLATPWCGSGGGGCWLHAPTARALAVGNTGARPAPR